MKNTLLATLLFFAGIASAQNTVFNSPSNGYLGGGGNNYNSYGNGYRGSNADTGSTWGAQTYGGVTTGTDSRGNSWTYDRSTGNYYNYGTGESRTHGRKNGW